MNIYEKHPGLKQIENHIDAKLQYVQQLDGYASNITLLKDQNSNLFIAKTPIKQYEHLTDSRLAYMEKILKNSATIIDTCQNTCLMKYVEHNNTIEKPYNPKEIVKLSKDVSYNHYSFSHFQFNDIYWHINILQKQCDRQDIQTVRSWGEKIHYRYTP